MNQAVIPWAGRRDGLPFRRHRVLLFPRGFTAGSPDPPGDSPCARDFRFHPVPGQVYCRL